MRIDTIDERLGLFRTMLDHAGIDPLDPAAVLEAELRTAAQRCLGCRVAEECRDWLREAPEDSPPPGFCRNAERFQGWVEREIAEADGAGPARD